LNQQKYLNWLKKNKAAYQKYLEKKAKEKTQENYLLSHWKEQIRVDRKIDLLNGKKLWWPLAYKYNKTEIIIHHTAANYNKFKTVEDVKKYIR